MALIDGRRCLADLELEDAHPRTHTTFSDPVVYMCWVWQRLPAVYNLLQATVKDGQGFPFSFLFCGEEENP